jgi:hypothetical protein
LQKNEEHSSGILLSLEIEPFSMSTNVFIALIVMGLVTVGGGGYLVYLKMQGSEGEKETPREVTTETKTQDTEKELPTDDMVSGTFASLLGLGQNLICQFTYFDGTSASDGTFYIAQGGERLRGDFTSTIGGQTIESHLIRNDGFNYTWSSSLNQGAKIKIEPEVKSQVTAQKNTQMPIDENTVYDCTPWSIDPSKFVLPSGIEFIDLKAQLDASLNAGGSIDTADLKAAQCGACRALPDETAQSRCLAALSCQ